TAHLGGISQTHTLSHHRLSTSCSALWRHMFTGIIEGLGTVETIDYTNDSATITIDAGALVADLELGGSLAVNGVCLTSTRRPAEQAPGLFTAEVMGETLRLTGLGTLGTGDRVNLERCTPASGRFDGHVVQGHV